MATSITLDRNQIARLAAFIAKHDLKNFFIAKDRGAYLGATSRKLVGDDGETCLFYFPGCDPEKDEDWYHTTRDKFGGDDFGEFFEPELLTNAIISGASSLRFTVGKKNITVTQLGRKAA